jgi:hypothetical protein
MADGHRGGVLREGASTEQVRQYVNGEALGEVWRRLWLPRRARSIWEELLPELGRVV